MFSSLLFVSFMIVEQHKNCVDILSQCWEKSSALFYPNPNKACSNREPCSSILLVGLQFNNRTLSYSLFWHSNMLHIDEIYQLATFEYHSKLTYLQNIEDFSLLLRTLTTEAFDRQNPTNSYCRQRQPNFPVESYPSGSSEIWMFFSCYGQLLYYGNLQWIKIMNPGLQNLSSKQRSRYLYLWILISTTFFCSSILFLNSPHSRNLLEDC